MYFRYLEYFLEIARDNNISKAAERLFVSQSAVNQYLLKLENELGTKLFERTPRNWLLTEAGKIYLEGCRKALLVRKDTYQKIADITESNTSTLTVGLTPIRGLIMFTSIYPELHQKYPGVTVIPIELNAQAQLTAASYGKIDLGFMVQKSNITPSHTTIDLGAEEMVVQVPSSNRFFQEKKDDSISFTATHGSYPILPVIDLKQLEDIPFVLTRKGSSGSVLRDICDSIFREANFSPKILMETTETPHIVRMAEACGCCGIVPRYYAEMDNPNFSYFVLPSHPTWNLYIIHRTDGYLTQAAREYIALAKKYWENHLIPPQSN